VTGSGTSTGTGNGTGSVHALRPTADPAASLAAPRLGGHTVTIRPVEARDFDFLFRLFTTGDHLVRYRLRGVTPSPDAFVRFLWEQTLAQFIVETPEGRPVGVVSSYEPDFRNRYVYVAACSTAEFETTGLVLEGMALLVSYLFATFDFRKVYAESLEANFAQFAFGEGRLFEVEGRMKEHEYINGRYQDFVLLAIYRDAWREQHRRIFDEEGSF
jgi:RimJ/RimL family protein N-acetyltransferase